MYIGFSAVTSLLCLVLALRTTHQNLLCRLKQLGLSTAGNKKDLEARLEQSMDSATADQPGASVLQPADIEKGKVRAKSRVAAGTGVFKAQKRKNFVRINLKVHPSFLGTGCDSMLCPAQHSEGLQ